MIKTNQQKVSRESDRLENQLEEILKNLPSVKNKLTKSYLQNVAKNGLPFIVEPVVKMSSGFSSSVRMAIFFLVAILVNQKIACNCCLSAPSYTLYPLNGHFLVVSITGFEISRYKLILKNIIFLTPGA